MNRSLKCGLLILAIGVTFGCGGSPANSPQIRVMSVG